MFFIFSASFSCYAQDQRGSNEEEHLFLQKAERIRSAIERSVAQKEANLNVFKGSLPKKEIMTIETARSQYDVNDWNIIKGTMLVFHGNVYVEGDINHAWFMKQLEGMEYNNLYGMIVLSDLWVNGSIIDDNYLYLIVQKNTEADFIESNDGLMIFNGDLKALYGIYGEYNDGSLIVHGNVYSPYLIASDHDMPRIANQEWIYIEGGDGDEKSSVYIGKTTGSGIAWNWYYFEPSYQLFSDKVWDKEGLFSVKQFFDLVRNGESPFSVSE